MVIQATKKRKYSAAVKKYGNKRYCNLDQIVIIVTLLQNNAIVHYRSKLKVKGI